MLRISLLISFAIVSFSLPLLPCGKALSLSYHIPALLGRGKLQKGGP